MKSSPSPTRSRWWLGDILGSLDIKRKGSRFVSFRRRRRKRTKTILSPSFSWLRKGWGRERGIIAKVGKRGLGKDKKFSLCSVLFSSPAVSAVLGAHVRGRVWISCYRPGTFFPWCMWDHTWKKQGGEEWGKTKIFFVILIFWLRDLGVGEFIFKNTGKLCFPRSPTCFHACSPRIPLSSNSPKYSNALPPTSPHEKEIPLNSIMIYGKMQDAPDEFLLSSQCRLLHPGPGILRSGRPAKEVRRSGGTYCIRHLFSVKYLFIYLLDVS